MAEDRKVCARERTMVGIGLFLLLFVYMVFQDVSSLFGA